MGIIEAVKAFFSGALEWEEISDPETGNPALQATLYGGGSYVVTQDGDGTFTWVLQDVEGFPVDMRCNLPTLESAVQDAEGYNSGARGYL